MFSIWVGQSISSGYLFNENYYLLLSPRHTTTQDGCSVPTTASADVKIDRRVEKNRAVRNGRNSRRPAPSSSSTTIDHCRAHHPARVQYHTILTRVFCKSRVKIRRRRSRFGFWNLVVDFRFRFVFVVFGVFSFLCDPMSLNRVPYITNATAQVRISCL